jgi:hypothetical protein
MEGCVVATVFLAIEEASGRSIGKFGGAYFRIFWKMMIREERWQEDHSWRRKTANGRIMRKMIPSYFN